MEPIESDFHRIIGYMRRHVFINGLPYKFTEFSNKKKLVPSKISPRVSKSYTSGLALGVYWPETVEQCVALMEQSSALMFLFDDDFVEFANLADRNLVFLNFKRARECGRPFDAFRLDYIHYIRQIEEKVISSQSEDYLFGWIHVHMSGGKAPDFPINTYGHQFWSLAMLRPVRQTCTSVIVPRDWIPDLQKKFGEFTMSAEGVRMASGPTARKPDPAAYKP